MNENQSQSQNEEQQPAEGQQLHYFIATGEVEYIEGERPGYRASKEPKYRKVNFTYRSGTAGLTARDLGRIQVQLQLNFHSKYARMHKHQQIGAAMVTDCVILGTSYIGCWTEKEFLDKAPVGPAEKDEVQEAVKK